jgi:WD40 repeat protein
MRPYRVKDCNRIQGLSFTPDGRELLVIGGYEAQGVETAVWLALDRGEPARKMDLQFADGFALTADHSCLIVASGASTRSALKNLVRWRDAREPKAKWVPVKVASGWPRNSTYVIVDAFALADADRLVVAYSRQLMAEGSRRDAISWTSHLAIVPLKSDGRTTVRDLDRPLQLLAIAPDGSRCVVLVGEDPVELQLCEEPGGEPVASYPLPTAQTGTVAFSPDGRLVAVPNFRSVYLFDTRGLREEGNLQGHTKKVNALAFTADGR